MCWNIEVVINDQSKSVGVISRVFWSYSRSLISVLRWVDFAPRVPFRILIKIVSTSSLNLNFKPRYWISKKVRTKLWNDLSDRLQWRPCRNNTQRCWCCLFMSFHCRNPRPRKTFWVMWKMAQFCKITGNFNEMGHFRPKMHTNLP